MTTPIVVNPTDTFEEWRVKTNQIAANVATNVQSNVYVLEASNTAVGVRLTALENSNTEIRSNLTSLYGNISIVYSNLTAVYGNIESVNSNIQAINSNVATIIAVVNQIDANVGQIESNIDIISSNVDSLIDDVENLGSNVASISFIVDGGGATIETGNVGDVQVPYNCIITGWTMLADQTGNIVMDIMKDTYANFPPVHADVITGSQIKPRINSGIKNTTSTLTGWSSTTITAGDILRFNVASISTITRATLVLDVKKTP